ncbi:MAG: hypothetical protein AB7I96_10570 [Candidatus Dadabacteria bacterium]
MFDVFKDDFSLTEILPGKGLEAVYLDDSGCESTARVVLRLVLINARGEVVILTADEYYDGVALCEDHENFLGVRQEKYLM